MLTTPPTEASASSPTPAGAAVTTHVLDQRFNPVSPFPFRIVARRFAPRDDDPANTSESVTLIATSGLGVCMFHGSVFY
jgi:hypothetical protein